MRTRQSKIRSVYKSLPKNDNPILEGDTLAQKFEVYETQKGILRKFDNEKEEDLLNELSDEEIQGGIDNLELGALTSAKSAFQMAESSN